MYSIHSYKSIYNTIIKGDFFLCIASIATDQHNTHEKGDLFLSIVSIATGQYLSPTFCRGFLSVYRIRSFRSTYNTILGDFFPSTVNKVTD